MKELEADGSILEVDARNGFVVIGAGQADHVFPGLLLDVFQFDKGRYQLRRQHTH